MSTVRVEAPGLLSTLQDLGRPGMAHLGISASGAADALALRLGNWLVGNAENAAGIEMTLVGGTFRLTTDTIVAVTGSDFGAVLRRSGTQPRELPPWHAVPVQSGDVLACGPSRRGARSYLCVRGGFDVPAVLGSRSTHLLTGLGGLGRPLRAGDTLRLGDATSTAQTRTVDTRWIEAQYVDAPLRITPGPQIDWFDAAARTRLGDSTYEVLEQSNRMGIRLAGPALERTVPGELITEGVSLGAIQVPENAQPILLFVEHQTTGGYPKIANVCSADMHRVGQLRPRDRVRFAWVSFDAAHRLNIELQEQLRASGWDISAEQ